MKSLSEKPLVSIVMPSFNSSDTIAKSISSVLSQTYDNWELVIVDDFSSDDTLDKLKQFNDPRIKVVALPSNSGSPAYPRNIGIEYSNGDYIAFLDSDDLWKEKKLEVQLKAMTSKGINFSCTGYTVLKDGNITRSFTPPEKVHYDQLLCNNSIGCLTAMVSKDLMGDLRFPLCGHEDFALWLKLSKKTDYVLGIKTHLAEYNLVDGSVSSAKSKLIPFFWNIYRNEEGFSRTKSLYYCFLYLIHVLFFKYKKII
ncbi:hypothetical protein AOR11_15565 [Vibrio alginolyticus]|uniref:glycosyltransferase family 2 protein n=1 Tax=Vibrio TaxID=662 RepID=UPI0006CA63B7|nr:MULTISPECIES: glycosyltransferase family 2 protein [Vibrio]QCO84790.1 glycosyltransferase family 2 protein [Vibrio neocaledonicus]EGQ8469057.1 glycosyltransferase [Vibrio alginolyticus]KPN01981.1 hypothetical protein AOR11_15565 [Vibrio alginolyticus]MBS9864160.1 glycosyltransferase family 2 protein [Vibrio alginolyticus]MBS9887343.1 glycosyltransferase family 2 protein [Vibrio alginolyticus]